MDPEDLNIYHRRVAEARAVGLGMTRVQSLAFVGILENYAEELAKRVSRGVATKGEQYALREAREIIGQMSLDLEGSTNRGIAVTAERGAAIHADAIHRLMSSSGVAVGQVLSGIGVTAAQAVSSRKQLAGSFVSIRRGAIMQTDRIIKASLLQGITGPQLGMRLRTMIIGAGSLPSDLVLDRRRIGKRAVERMGLAPTPQNVRLVRKQAGFIANRANLIARTEPMNAEWEAHIQASRQSPVTNGLKWNLSGRHPEPDICDDLAGTDWYGLGPGVFPITAVPPRPHPRCICYHTDLIRPIEDWMRPKPFAPRRRHRPFNVAMSNGRSLSSSRALERAFRVGDVHERRLASLKLVDPEWIRRRSKLFQDIGGAVSPTLQASQLQLPGIITGPRGFTQEGIAHSVTSPRAGLLPWISKTLLETPKGAMPEIDEFVTELVARFGHGKAKVKDYFVVNQAFSPTLTQQLTGGIIHQEGYWSKVTRSEFIDDLRRGFEVRMGMENTPAIKSLFLNMDMGPTGYYDPVERGMAFDDYVTLALQDLLDEFNDEEPWWRKGILRSLSLDGATDSRTGVGMGSGFVERMAKRVEAVQVFLHELGHSRSPMVVHQASGTPMWFSEFDIDLEEGINNWGSIKWTLSSLYSGGGRVAKVSDYGQNMWRRMTDVYPNRTGLLQRMDAWGRRGALDRIWQAREPAQRRSIFMQEWREGLKLHRLRKGITKKSMPLSVKAIEDFMVNLDIQQGFFGPNGIKLWDVIDSNAKGTLPAMADDELAEWIEELANTANYHKTIGQTVPPQRTLTKWLAQAKDVAREYSLILNSKGLPASKLPTPIVDQLEDALFTVPGGIAQSVTEKARRGFSVNVMESVGAYLGSAGWKSLDFVGKLPQLATWDPRNHAVTIGQRVTESIDEWMRKLQQFAGDKAAMLQWLEAGIYRERLLGVSALVHEAGHSVTPASGNVHRWLELYTPQTKLSKYLRAAIDLEEGYNASIHRSWVTAALYGHADWRSKLNLPVFQAEFLESYTDFMANVNHLQRWFPDIVRRNYLNPDPVARVNEFVTASARLLTVHLNNASAKPISETEVIGRFRRLLVPGSGSVLSTTPTPGSAFHSIQAIGILYDILNIGKPGNRSEVGRPPLRLNSVFRVIDMLELLGVKAVLEKVPLSDPRPGIAVASGTHKNVLVIDGMLP